MTLLEVIQLIGYSMAATLHFWIGGLLFKRRHLVGDIERVLMVLALAMGVWHGANLIVAAYSMLGIVNDGWLTFLRFVDSCAVISITFSYSLLLHVHLYLWADARNRPLNKTERVRVYLSYIPTVFLIYAVPKMWKGVYAPMFVKLSKLLLPFALWATYVLCLVAITDLFIAHLNRSASERRLLRTLAASFICIAAMIFGVYAAGIGEGADAGLYLKTFANLGSLLPTALLAYHIYRYRYLELIIKESLIAASFAAVVLVVYLYGIRQLGEMLTARYGLRMGVVESILILMLALTAAPLRHWLDNRFRLFFERETAIYRDVVARIGAQAGKYRQLPELLHFVEERTAAGLGLRRVRVIELSGKIPASDNAGGLGEQNTTNGKQMKVSDASVVEERSVGAPANIRRDSGPSSDDAEAWELFKHARRTDGATLEGDENLRRLGYELALPLNREKHTVGWMLIDAAPDALTYDVRSMLEILAGQVAIAIEDCRLVEENVRLERQVAHGERLAALGQMAATVAHEIKNPLSAIKSIAQVMREDAALKNVYERDLSLIISETDRLGRSVSQMLNFARITPHEETSQQADELVLSIIHLFSSEAEKRGVRIGHSFDFSNAQLDGACATALRDALSNLILNALQATQAGGSVLIKGSVENEKLYLLVQDEGQGIARDDRQRIWEPFFTTKQRGTGLGLAIVRKRIEEVGGVARLVDSVNGTGARFELVVPLGG